MARTRAPRRRGSLRRFSSPPVDEDASAVRKRDVRFLSFFEIDHQADAELRMLDDLVERQLHPHRVFDRLAEVFPLGQHLVLGCSDFAAELVEAGGLSFRAAAFGGRLARARWWTI